MALGPKPLSGPVRESISGGLIDGVKLNNISRSYEEQSVGQWVWLELIGRASGTSYSPKERRIIVLHQK